MPKKVLKKETSEMEPALQEIAILLKRQNSLKYTFLRGVVRGLGTTLGATLLVAFITSVAFQLFSSVYIDEMVKTLFSAMFE